MFFGPGTLIAGHWEDSLRRGSLQQSEHPHMKREKTMDESMMERHPAKPASERGRLVRKQRVRRRVVSPGLPPSRSEEEVLVVDDRAYLRPAQIVESKLTKLLQDASVPVSHLQMRGLLRAR